MLEAKVENGKLKLTLTMQPPTPSATGKTLVVASTHGNVATTVMVNGKPLTVGVNAYIVK